MSTKMKEKRENKRAFFTLEDNITASVEPHKNGGPVQVIILSISAGGLSFVGARQKVSGIKEGDRFTLKGFEAPEPLGRIDSVEAEVKYILDHDVNIRVAFGCEFTKITASSVPRIEEYVNFRYREMGLEDKNIQF